MFRPIRSSHRPATPIARLTATVGADPIVRAGLVAVPIGATAVIFRDKLASIVTRGGEE